MVPAVVKIHNKNMIFLIICDMSGVDESEKVNQHDNHNSKF